MNGRLGIRAGDYKQVPPPEAILERARRLYVLAPLVDPGTPPVSFWFDAPTWSATFSISLQQGDSCELTVSPEGTVVSGLNIGASVWNPDRTTVEQSLDEEADARVLLQLLGVQRPQWAGFSYCIWRRRSDRDWQTARGMFRDAEASQDELTLLEWLALPLDAVVERIGEYAEARPATRQVFRRFLGAPWPEVVAAMRKLRGEKRDLVERRMSHVAAPELFAGMAVRM